MTAPADAATGTGAVRLRRVRALDPDTVDRWWALAERAAEPNPFAAPGVVRAAAAHLPGGDRALLLTVEHAGRMVFALPVVREPATVRRPFPVLSAWQAYFPPLATPLLDAPHAVAAWRMVRAGMGAVWLDVEPMAADGPVAAALAEAAGDTVRTLERAERAVAFRDGARIRVSAKTRRSLEARRRGLGEAIGAEPVTFRVDPGEPVPDGLVDRFLSLEASGWKGRGGTALACDPATAAFFRDLTAAHAARDGLQIVGVRCGDDLVAATVNLVCGDGLFFYKIAYDETYRTASPGRILMADNLDALAGDPSLTFADSCAAPGASLSNQMLRDRRTVARLIVPAAGTAADLVTGAALAARAARHRLTRRTTAHDT